MQCTKSPNYFKFMRLVNVFMLSGLATVSFYPQPASADTKTYSLWCNSTRPITTKPDTETRPVELGVKFSTRVDGKITAIRFYRFVPSDSGYAVHLWSSTGQLLGSGVAIEGQSPTPGWQTVQIYPPVPIVSGQTYIASYYASNGRYAADENFFNNARVDNGPLSALRDGVDGGNSVYVYTTKGASGFAGTFPTESYKATNYWVDVVFKTTLPASSNTGGSQ
jgi:hypothetical protein